MLKTRLCELLGIDLPIIVAPMGFVTGPELAAAVSNAPRLSRCFRSKQFHYSVYP